MRYQFKVKVKSELYLVWSGPRVVLRVRILFFLDSKIWTRFFSQRLEPDMNPEVRTSYSYGSTVWIKTHFCLMKIDSVCSIRGIRFVCFSYDLSMFTLGCFLNSPTTGPVPCALSKRKNTNLNKKDVSKWVHKVIYQNCFIVIIQEEDNEK